MVVPAGGAPGARTARASGPAPYAVLMRPTLLPGWYVHPWHPDAVHEGNDETQRARYTERLWAPVSWWVVVLVLVATLALALGVPLGPAAGVLTMAGGAVVATWLFVRSAALVEV